MYDTVADGGNAVRFSVIYSQCCLILIIGQVLQVVVYHLSLFTWSFKVISFPLLWTFVSLHQNLTALSWFCYIWLALFCCDITISLTDEDKTVIMVNHPQTILQMLQICQLWQWIYPSCACITAVQRGFFFFFVLWRKKVLSSCRWEFLIFRELSQTAWTHVLDRKKCFKTKRKHDLLLKRQFPWLMQNTETLSCQYLYRT